MKRICFCGHFTAGGTEKATFMLANALQGLYQIYMINTCDRKPTFFLDDKIKMDYLDTGNILFRGIKLGAYLKKNRIDILISVEAMTGIYTMSAAKIARCKHIVWEHANYYQTQGSRWIQKIRQRELKTVDAYIVLTKRDCRNFGNNFTIKTKLEWLYNIADRKEILSYNNDSKVIVSAGHFRDVKNFIIIPEIGNIIFKKHPDWVWKIYGNADNDYGKQVSDKIKLNGLENNIILCGRCNDMDRAYEEAAIYVLTSKYEGLPLVLLEAQAHRLPIISFDIETGPDEIIQNEINGILVEPYSISEMADAICRLIDNSEQRQCMSMHSLDDFNRFSVDSILPKWAELIESIC